MFVEGSRSGIAEAKVFLNIWRCFQTTQKVTRTPALRACGRLPVAARRRGPRPACPLRRVENGVSLFCLLLSVCVCPPDS